ncbi:hypothetical protein Tco_0314045 [Tanacetum coccineum]
MDPTSSLERIFLGEKFMDHRVKKLRDMEIGMLPSTQIQLVVRKRRNGLEAYDGKINLAFDENLISNDYAVKLCLDYEVKKGNKVVKKELIVALKGELYFVKFIINPKEDDVEPGVIFGRSFMRLVNGIVDFGSGVVTVYPEEDPFKNDSEKTEKNIKTSSSTRRHLTQEEAAKEALAIRISKKGFLYTIGGIVNTPERLFLTFDEICHQTFHAARSDVLRTTESDSDDEEEYRIKRNKFGAPIYCPKPAVYLNCNDLAERSLALQAVINPFRKISVWNNVVSFLGSLPIPLQQVNWKPDYKGCYTNEEESKGQWHTEIRTMGGNDDEAGSSRSKRSRQKETVEELLISQLCHEFYSTYEFDEVCANDELQTKKLIKFRLGGRAHSLTLLEFARRLGLYQADELDEDGFDVYFQRGLCSDDHFKAQEYWLSISQEENLSLSRSHASTIRNPILWVIHKMITYGLCQRTTGYDNIQKNDLWLLSMFDARHQNGYANMAWLIARWMKRKGIGTQKESQICCGQLITKIARKVRELNDVVLRTLSALIYCIDLDTTTLRELIDFEGRQILEDPQPGIPTVGIPRPPRASMHDLYERMGNMEIRQGRLRGSPIHSHIIGIGMLEYLSTWLGFYSVDLQGAYNPLRYA